MENIYEARGTVKQAWDKVKGAVMGTGAGVILITTLFAYNAHYEANLYEERSDEMLEIIAPLYDNEFGFGSETEVEATNAVMGLASEIREDDYITLHELSTLKTEVRKWKVIRATLGE